MNLIKLYPHRLLLLLLLFSVFTPNTGKYGPETPYLDTFLAASAFTIHGKTKKNNTKNNKFQISAPT